MLKKFENVEKKEVKNKKSTTTTTTTKHWKMDHGKNVHVLSSFLFIPRRPTFFRLPSSNVLLLSQISSFETAKRMWVRLIYFQTVINIHN